MSPGCRRRGPALRALIERGERIGCSALVLYEWRRGPRQPDELRVQKAPLPSHAAAAFGPSEASHAADLYRRVRRARRREVDLAIAACALTNDAGFWTLNPADFSDVPGLRLVAPAG